MSIHTPLFDCHQAENARIVDFAGWDMPVQYRSITAEHKTVRESAGIFDVGHMGRFFITGDGAGKYLENLTVSRTSDLEPGRVRYSLVCNAEGGTKDDVLITCLEPESFLVVVNASNREKLLPWFQQNLPPSVRFDDRTLQTAMIAVQGPESSRIVRTLLNTDCSVLGYYHCTRVDDESWISRTGYTGEDGFEIVTSNERIVELWQRALEQGAKPIGLGARDSLRLEMGYPLYGHELSEDVSPLEAGLQWAVHFDGHDFTGKDALLQQKETGIPRRRLAFRLTGQGIPRQGCAVYDGGEAVGEVTSGGFSPILNQGFGLALVRTGHHASDHVSIEIRNKKIPAERVTPPFIPKRVKG